jgi:hypothetical protein
MSKIAINELRQSSELLQTLAAAEADRVVGGAYTAISFTLDPAAFNGTSSSSSSSSGAFASSVNEGGVTKEYGFSFKTRSENGVQLERKFEKFGDFPKDFVFPNF